MALRIAKVGQSAILSNPMKLERSLVMVNSKDGRVLLQERCGSGLCGAYT
jgi:hypothetical protein